MPVETAAQKAEKETAEKNAANRAAAEKAVNDANAANENVSAVKTGRDAPSTESVTQDKPETKADEVKVPQSYVWLNNGEVLRVNDEDLPGASGAQNAFGHWQRGNKVYTVVAVHPVEDVLEGN